MTRLKQNLINEYEDKVLLITLIAILSVNTYTTMAQNNKRILITYFSATGTTEQAAQKLAAVTGGDLFEIVPVTGYTAADLNWQPGRLLNRASESTIRTWLEGFDCLK